MTPLDTGLSVDTGLPVAYSPLFLEHHQGPDHPERPARLSAVVGSLQREPPVPLSWPEPDSATQDQVARIHRPEYLALLERIRGRSIQLDIDTATSPASVDAAYLAAGAAIATVDAALDAEGPALALVRPPGHHAEADRAMGFCLLNNVAIAAAHAVAARGLERVLLIDWDVHHGNGTQNSFEERRDVLFLSLHRGQGFYPGTGLLAETGLGDGAGFTVNAPLPAGCGDDVYRLLLERLIEPIAARYQPQLVLVSAGFDAHRRDPLGGMRVTDDGFAMLARGVRRIADRYARGALALVLEGGYDLQALVGSIRALLVALHETPSRLPSDPEPATETDETDERVEAVGTHGALVERICEVHRSSWPEVGAGGA